MIMPGRSYSSNSYRYGFNGMEKGDEISGSGNSYTAEYWQYDSRLGRRWNQDPKPNISISNYAAFANNPILFSDPLGDTIVIRLLTETTDPKIFLASQKLVKEQVNDGIFIIVAHMNPNSILNNKDKYSSGYIHADDFAREISLISNDFKEAYEKGNVKSVILAGCNSASDPYTYFDENPEFLEKESLAQKISRDNKIKDVVGTTGYIEFDSKSTGNGISAVSSKYKPDRIDNNDGYNDKDLVRYRNGVKVTKDERGKNIKSRQPHSDMLEHTKNNNGIDSKQKVRKF